MKLRSALVALGMVALPAAAMAQPVDGLYVGAGLGYNYLQGQSATGPAAKIKGNGGFIGLGSVGYGFGNGFRAEIEGNFRQSTHTVSGLGASEKNRTYGGMVNGLYDFDVGSSYVYPYVGVGVGYEETSECCAFSGIRGSAAAQGIVGASFPIPPVPGLSVTAEYRFMATFEHEVFSDGIRPSDQYNHAGLIGLRYAFGTPVVEAAAPPPAPAPVVAPTPPPARTYLVFFDWDKSDLSARARQIISEAASNAAKVKVTRIEVSGYADLSGTHAYNLALSQRRGDAVAAELVSDGVPKSEIVVQAFGDSHPLVPTAPGVREPQNRRVEIVLK
jgi:outer membrane protein OmpA-like peptidoglycan-associated protein